jgi:tetratricopeptide (TPR) repeat protein
LASHASAATPAVKPDADPRRAQAVEKSVAEARRLLDAGKADEATRLLAPVRKRLGEDRDPRVEGLRRIHHKFAEGRAVYAEVVKKWPETIYAEASRLYAAKCLVGMGKTDEAKRELHAFRKSDPYGLYRGEAAVEMGRIALEHDLQPKAARGAFLLAETWLQEVQNRQPLNIERLAVPEKARKVTAPPGQEKSVDFWGNVEKNAIEPGELVNRNTCSWYLDDLKEQCAMYLGFLAFVDGKKDEALAHYRKILECDPTTRRLDTEGKWNDYSRLKWGAEHGYLYAYPRELAAFKDSGQRLGVLLADFYYITQRWDEARRMAHRLLKNEAGALSTGAREYAQYVHAAAVYRTDGREKAVPEYMKVVKAGGGRLKTFTQQRAAYAAANLARGSSKKELRDLARDLLMRLVKSPQQSTETYKARIVLAQNLIREHHVGTGIALLRSMPSSAGDYKALADHCANKCMEAEAQKRKGH